VELPNSTKKGRLKNQTLWEIPVQDRIYLSTARDYELCHNAIDTGIQLENNDVLAHKLKIHCMIYTTLPSPMIP
jgi:hypothetical protein